MLLGQSSSFIEIQMCVVDVRCHKKQILKAHVSKQYMMHETVKQHRETDVFSTILPTLLFNGEFKKNL